MVLLPVLRDAVALATLIVALSAPCHGQRASELLVVELPQRDVSSRLDGRDPSAWRLAWARVRELGPAAGAVLWERLPRAREPMRRLVRLGAYVVASGAEGQSNVLDRDWLLAPAVKKPERLMALIALAFEPSREFEAPAAYLLASKSPATSVRVAACTALARGPAVEPLPEAWFGVAGGVADPGLCAAALLCGAGPPPPVLETVLTTPDVPGPRAQLVWRALFVSRHREKRDESRRLALARRALRWSDEPATAVRGAAAACLARAGDPDAALAEIDALDGDALACLVHTAAGRAAALGRGWLRVVPSALFSRDVRRQLVAAFTLAATPAEVTGAFATWEQEPELLDAACGALAWRVLQQPGTWTPGRWLEPARGSARAAWLRLALGETLGPDVTGARGAHPALVLAADGRLPPAAMAREVERELWRAGAHPGAAAWRTWTSLVRDLLLSGSDYASAKAARPEAFPYLPGDLVKGDGRFFEPAVEYVDWREGARDVVPVEVRLSLE